MAKKIVYLIPGLHFPSGMERVLTLKANYLADEFGYDVTVILTEEKDKPFYYPLSPKVKTINFDLNFDRMYGLPLHRRLVYYRKRLRKFKKMLTSTLCELKPDITVSLLRRDINFLNTVPDGSVKIGEIHFNRSNYRDFNNRMLPGFVRDAVKKYWNAQLIRELKKLKKFVVLTREDEALWTELDNVTTIHNPLPFYPGPRPCFSVYGRTGDCRRPLYVAEGIRPFDRSVETGGGPSSGLDVANLRGRGSDDLCADGRRGRITANLPFGRRYRRCGR